MKKKLNEKTDFATSKLRVEDRFDSNYRYFKNYIIYVSRNLTDYEKRIVERYYCEILDSLTEGKYRVEIGIISLKDFESIVNLTTYFIYDESRNEYIIEV